MNGVIENINNSRLYDCYIQTIQKVIKCYYPIILNAFCIENPLLIPYVKAFIRKNELLPVSGRLGSKEPVAKPANKYIIFINKEEEE